MKCKQVHELISAYLDGELDERTTARVMAHLEKCSDCRQVLKDLSAVVEHVSGAPRFDVPAGLHEEVMERVERESLYSDEWDEMKPVNARVRWITTAFLAAACVVFVIGAFQVVRHGLKPGRPGLMETLKTKSAERGEGDKGVLLARADKAEKAAETPGTGAAEPAAKAVAKPAETPPPETGRELAAREVADVAVKSRAPDESHEGKSLVVAAVPKAREAARAERDRSETPAKTERAEANAVVFARENGRERKEAEPQRAKQAEEKPAPAVLARRAAKSVLAEREAARGAGGKDLAGKKPERFAGIAKDLRADDLEKQKKAKVAGRKAPALETKGAAKPAGDVAASPSVAAQMRVEEKKGRAARLSALVGRLLDGDPAAGAELQRAVKAGVLDSRYARDVERISRAIAAGAPLKNVQYRVPAGLVNVVRPAERAETVVWVVEPAQAPSVQATLTRELGFPARVRSLTHGKGTAWEFVGVRRDRMDLNAYLKPPRGTQSAPARPKGAGALSAVGGAKAAVDEKTAASRPAGPAKTESRLRYVATRPAERKPARRAAQRSAADVGNIIVVFKRREKEKESK